MALVTHHAQLYWAENLTATGIDIPELEKKAEIIFIKSDRLSISEVRDIVTRANRLPLEKPLQIIIIEVTSIAVEAQQALLKILEEPPSTTQFLLVIQPGATVLPTVLSRCQVMNSAFSKHQTAEFNAGEFSLFLSYSLPQRIKIITEKNKKKDDTWFLVLAKGLNHWLEKNNKHATTEILAYASYLQQRGASKKMIWEALAFLLPIGSQ